MSLRFATCSVLLALGLLLPSAAEARVPIKSLSTTPSTTQAGAHPDVAFRIEFGTWYTELYESKTPPPCYCNVPRQIANYTPAGVIGIPRDLPQCTAAEFAINGCPVDSQLGIAMVRLAGSFENFAIPFFMPLYNMVAGDDQLALLAFPAPIAETAVYVGISARTESDYGLEFRTDGIPAFLPPSHVSQAIWGIPADPSHDALRFPYEGLPFSHDKYVECENLDFFPSIFAGEYPPAGCHTPFKPVPSNSALVPFTSNPTACVGPLSSSADIFSYDLETEHAEVPYEATTGCDQLTFEPSLVAKPTTTEADSPSGLDLNLTIPQTLSPSTPTPSAIRDLTVTLPPGFTINANAADGKTACTAADARFGTREAAHCPDTAKIGSIGVTSTSFPEVLPGSLYIGEPLPGERYRVFLVFDGFSLHVKLPGTATPDPATGQLSITFEDLPQFVFQEFDLHVFGAERGLLTTPTQCGTYPVNSEFTPWAYPSIPKQTSTQFFKIESGPGGAPCPPASRPFVPAVEAGVADNTGGAHTTFSFDVRRSDGDQNLDTVTVKTPPGFSATIAGIPYCPDATLAALAASSYLGAPQLASPACAASLLGRATASAGAGSRPVSLSGNVYLAGPYRGAPLSLAIVTPAVSGPYDLGNVVVRVALRIDPNTAQVTAVSDPLPQILDGIPLRLRRVQIVLDRPGFALNPTNCKPFSVESAIGGDQGAVSTQSSYFQVANCADLPYSPKLSLRLTGGVRRRGHPAIHAVFRAAPHEANTRMVRVLLPEGELLDNAHIGAPCTRVQFAADSCPASSRIGKAEARTPLLDQPLKGWVYLRSSSRDLPDLAVDLRGQIDFTLVGHVDSVNARLRTTFDTVPDVPVGSFRLDLLGGHRGLLQNSESLCGEQPRAKARLSGQNGASVTRKVPLEIACGRKR